MITFGAQYKDIVTGFQGVAIGRTEYMTGCAQVLIIPPVDKDGKRLDGEWFDEQRLVRVGDTQISFDNGETPGCDIAAPRR